MTADEWDVTTDAASMMGALHEPLGFRATTIRRLALHILKPDWTEAEAGRPRPAADERYRIACSLLLDPDGIHPDEEAARAFNAENPHEVFRAARHFGHHRDGSQDARVIREIVGNPFRPVTLHPSWLTSSVVALVKGIREDGAFDRFALLADALMDAGCDNGNVLAIAGRTRPTSRTTAGVGSSVYSCEGNLSGGEDQRDLPHEKWTRS